MSKNNLPQTNWLREAALRATRVHFWLIIVFAAVVVASDAWALTSRELVWQRWGMIGILLVVNSTLWYFAHWQRTSVGFYRALLLLLVLLDIYFASFIVYTEGGMDSRGVALYAISLITSAMLLSRSAIYATALLCTAGYLMATTRYFYVFFNEGYKAELYTALVLYTGSFFVAAALLWALVRPNKK